MNHLYIRLARTNMKNSRQFYIPYLLTGILSAAMFYIMTSIVYNSGLEQMRGADVITSILGMGASVTGIFICIFLFYTNSFIIKQKNTIQSFLSQTPVFRSQMRFPLPTYSQ